jgi:APA family basic amino acid/polyamine antiporter
MLQTLAGPAGLTAMSLVILCSTFGAINTNLLEAPRITFAMGRDGTFFRTLGQVHAVHRTPVASILANAVLAVALIAAAALGKRLVRDEPLSGYDWELTRRIVQSLQDDSIFDLLTNFVIFGSSIFYALAVFAVVVLRIRAPHRARPYRAWGYPLTPLLFCGVYVWFLMQVYAGKPLESRVGLALIALGLPVYFAFRRWGHRDATGS